MIGVLKGGVVTTQAKALQKTKPGCKVKVKSRFAGGVSAALARCI